MYLLVGADVVRVFVVMGRLLVSLSLVLWYEVLLLLFVLCHLMLMFLVL